MNPRRLALIPAISLLVAACSSAGASPAAPSAEPSASASPAAAQTRIEVTLTDELKIQPAAMTVPAEVPVTFVVTNAGALDHEFVLGDEAVQAAHQEKMMAGGMRHDEPNAIAVKPGETRELTFTFEEPGEMLAGCQFPGHYAGGMKASITVTG